ncbi:holo-ACP synthase [Faecalicoccus pleomorphus]|uniref:holo-ACP synthase n=1 Tax=Faecalicoccus pleomorphus TaxID=1323 RepID=UPI0039F484F8
MMRIGCDIVQIQRIRPSLAHKILSETEQKMYEGLKERRAVEFLAGHFAAKEAVFKTLDKPVDFKDIEITYDQMGRPICNIENVQISISHEKEYAMAVALRVFL